MDCAKSQADQDDQDIISVRGLTVHYPGSARPAVDALDLSLKPGEVFGFLGPNGAGKTSTMRVLAALLIPTAGYVRIAGHELGREADQIRQKVGFLPDFFGMPERLSARSYLEFFAALQGVQASERGDRVATCLELVDAGDLAERQASQLSRGQEQRIGLARVLLHEPELLLLDEPASGLDPRARLELRDILVELGAMGRGVMVSSHVLSDLAATCNSVGIMEQGQLLFRGPVEEALEEAATRLRRSRRDRTAIRPASAATGRPRFRQVHR